MGIFVPIQCSPISEITLLFGRFSGFAALFFCKEKQVHEGDYGVLVE
jgi:hypothetical protein